MESISERLAKALVLIGFLKGERQESRMLSLLNTILELETDPPIPLDLSQIYDKMMRDDPLLSLSKQWVSRVLKDLVDLGLIRLENPISKKRRYIADVNTIMAGLERLKSEKAKGLEEEIERLGNELKEVNALDCGSLARSFVEEVMGQEQKISSRVVRGVEELHRILRYNMLDVAKEGDIIRATVLWVGPFLDEETRDRTVRFINAAKQGAEVRYFITTDVFKIDDKLESRINMKGIMHLMQNIVKLQKSGIKFHVRIFAGKKTYNQISFNRESTALIITENPMTATWITRDFNPDLIDNAVDAFDRDWEHGKPFFELTPKDLEALGASPDAAISKTLARALKE